MRLDSNERNIHGIIYQRGYMKKSFIFIAILLSLFSLNATEERRNVSYSYFSAGIGYGALVPSINGSFDLSNGVDITLDGGYIIGSKSFGFGLGAREDLIIVPKTQNSDVLITSHTVIGPSFTIPITNMFNINLLIGPTFSSINTGGKRNVFAMGPALDASFEVYAPSIPEFAFKAGVCSYVSFGISEPLTSFTATGYASFVIKLGDPLFLLYPLLLLMD